MTKNIKKIRNKKASQLCRDLYPVVKDKLLPLALRWQQEHGYDASIDILEKVSIDDIVIFIRDKSCS